MMSNTINQYHASQAIMNNYRTKSLEEVRTSSEPNQFISESKSSRSYINNTLSDKDQRFIKEFSTSMSSLYGAASGLNSSKGSNANKTPEMVEKNTKEFVEKFNASVDFLEENKGKNKTINRLHDSLVSVGQTNKVGLQAIGITVADNGKMTIDEKKFNESITQDFGKVKDTLSQVAKKTESVAMRGASTSTQDLLKTTSGTKPNVMDEEKYYESIRKMAGNRQFMSFYGSAQSAISMMNLFV